MQKELVENGNGKAVFDFSLVTAFRVIENVSEKYLEEGFGAGTTQENESTTQETSKKSPRNIQEELLSIIQQRPDVTRKELEEILGYSTGKVKYPIEKMTKQGIIEREGPTKSGKWVIIKNEKS